VARVALDAIEAARMNGDHRSLHVDEIVLAQSALPFAAVFTCPRHARADLATSVPYPVRTCNVMTYLQLAELFGLLRLRCFSGEMRCSTELVQSFRTAASTCAASPA
jgi:hypothetical protein